MQVTSVGGVSSSSVYKGNAQDNPGNGSSSDLSSVTSSYLWTEAKDLAANRPVLVAGIVTGISSFLASLTTRATIQYLPLTFLPVVGAFFYELLFPNSKEEKPSESIESVQTQDPAIVYGESEGIRVVA